MKKINFNTRGLLIVISFLVAIISISNSCTKNSMSNMYSNGGGTGVPGANEVWIQGMAFSPSTITVTAGATITWTNKDAIAHTVTSNTSLFDSGSIASNGTFSHLFSTACTYPYHCSIHPSMTATIIVN
jgi:plastocyanin